MYWGRFTHQIQMTGITRRMPSRDMFLSETFFYFSLHLVLSTSFSFMSTSLHHPSTWLACLYTSPSTLPIFPALFVLFKGVNVKTLSSHIPASVFLSCSSLLMLCTLLRGVYNDKMIQTGPALRCLEHIGAWAITLSESSVHQHNVSTLIKRI